MTTKNTLAYTSDNPKLNYRLVIRRIKNGNLDYILGRFWTFRRIYSIYRSLKQSLEGKKETEKFPSQIINNSSLKVEDIIREIHQNSYFDQLQLNSSTVDSILQTAKTRILLSPSKSLIFSYNEYITKIKQTCRMATASVENPLDIDEVYRLRYDNFLLDIAEKYLGYYPENCDVMLWWSFADNLSPEERRIQLQTIDYHYDIHGFNFFYISFYLTDVDMRSGAHVLVRSSHRKKELSMLFRSARFSDKIIYKTYPEKDIIVIQGKAGKCFLEDASCLHKALPPIDKDRLFLQLRYF